MNTLYSPKAQKETNMNKMCTSKTLRKPQNILTESV